MAASSHVRNDSMHLQTTIYQRTATLNYSADYVRKATANGAFGGRFDP